MSTGGGAWTTWGEAAAVKKAVDDLRKDWENGGGAMKLPIAAAYQEHRRLIQERTDAQKPETEGEAAAGKDTELDLKELHLQVKQLKRKQQAQGRELKEVKRQLKAVTKVSNDLLKQMEQGAVVAQARAALGIEGTEGGEEM